MPCHPHIEPAPWDTDCFGYPVGRVRITKTGAGLVPGLVNKAKEQHYRLLYITVENAGPKNKALVSEILNRLEGADVVLADEKVFLQKIIKEPVPVLPENIGIWKQGMPEDVLNALALQAGEYSRFHTDKNFTGQEFEKMYARWLQASLENDPAKVVYVSFHKDKITGLVTLTKKPDHVNIGLIAVDRACRGKGTGKTLLQAASVFTLSQNLHTIRLNTQSANTPAMAFYLSQGFELSGVDLVFHCWL